MGDTKKYISMEELKAHNKRNDLWISIQGKVYNVTAWVDDHPGGELPLLSFAGQDVTDAFVAYHPGTAWEYLDKFFTGYFIKDYKVSEISKDYRKLMSEFTKMGLFEKKGHGAITLMCFTVILFAVSVYGVLCSKDFWVHLVCGGTLGFSWIQSGWIGHDSSHYQVMMNRKWNRFMQLLAGNCLTGLSNGWWKRIHNAHHIAVNSLEFDPDLQLMPFFLVSSKFFNSLTSYFHHREMTFDKSARFLVSYQHLTFYPVMCFARINLYIHSFLVLVTIPKVPNRALEIAALLIFWIWYPILISCLPNWPNRVAFVVASLAVTGIQHVQFCLNHFSSDVYLGSPGGNNWFEKQTSGTLDIACSPWMDWFHGGLQFQVEHHLFPRMPRCQLRKISPFVKELCKKHSIPYNCASFWEANVLTYNTLRATAFRARDLSNPVPRNLVWEAVSTHG